jgi:hypothetical protein
LCFDTEESDVSMALRLDFCSEEMECRMEEEEEEG